MTNTPMPTERAIESARPRAIPMTLEVIVIPVSEVDRAKGFYASLGWQLDLDFRAGHEYRVVQFTPPGSRCSVIFGKNVTAAAPGSLQGLHLIVPDVETVREELVRRGIEVSEPFHDVGGVFHHADGKSIVAGLNPKRQSYASYAAFTDPDGNGWVLQEVMARLSADIKADDPRFTGEVLNAIAGGTTT